MHSPRYLCMAIVVLAFFVGANGCAADIGPAERTERSQAAIAIDRIDSDDPLHNASVYVVLPLAQPVLHEQAP